MIYRVQKFKVKFIILIIFMYIFQINVGRCRQAKKQGSCLGVCTVHIVHLQLGMCTQYLVYCQQLGVLCTAQVLEQHQWMVQLQTHYLVQYSTPCIGLSKNRSAADETTSSQAITLNQSDANQIKCLLKKGTNDKGGHLMIAGWRLLIQQQFGQWPCIA